MDAPDRVARGGVLVDGLVRGAWQIDRDRGGATLLIEPFGPLHKRERTAVTDEGARLLAFAATNADAHDIRFVSVRRRLQRRQPLGATVR